ncbi:hypothetical protein PS6_003731 [Mucor atramentarius]
MASTTTDTAPTKDHVTSVGHANVGSDAQLSYLRDLYLPKEQNDRDIDEAAGLVVYKTITSYPPVKQLRPSERKRILVTGGAGFVGSKRNVQHWIGHPHFELVRHDVVDPFMIEVSQIYHLACPASPPHYQYNPTKTVKTSVMGTINMLGLAKRTKARFLLTSTSGK